MSAHVAARVHPRAGFSLSPAVGAYTLLSVVAARGGRGWFSPDTLECRTQSETLWFLMDWPLF